MQIRDTNLYIHISWSENVIYISLLDHQVDFNSKLLQVYILIFDVLVLLLLQSPFHPKYDLPGHLVNVIVEDLGEVLQEGNVRRLVPC